MAHRFPEKIAKCFVNGLKTESFREEMNSRTFEKLDDVIRERKAREEKREYPKSVVTFPKKNEANPTSGATFISNKKSGTFDVKDHKDVECYKCHKTGIMPTIVQKLRPKTQRGHLKYEKWKRGR